MKSHVKKLLTLALVLTLILSLVSCGNGNSSGEASQPSAETEFPDIDWQGGELCAVAYLGYYEESAIGEMTSPYTSTFHQLEGPDFGPFVMLEGYEVYLIIPRYIGSTITVNEYSSMKDEAGEVVYTTADYENYLVVVCNFSDLHSNSLITVTFGENSTSFSPFLSGMDGSVVLPSDGTVKNITLGSLYRNGSYAEYSERYLGSWHITTANQADPNGGLWVYFLNIYEDGSISFYHGFPEGDMIETFDGTYYIAGPDDPDYPTGALVYTMELTYTAMADGPIKEEDKYTVSGAYTIDYGTGFAGEDELILTHNYGTQLFQNANPREYGTYTLIKIADGGYING